jgi:hypothetical protein
LKEKKVTEETMSKLAASVRRLRRATEESKEEGRGAEQGIETSDVGLYWARGPARIDEDSGEIVLDEDRAELHLLYEHKGLLFDLVGLREGDKIRNVRAFVRRYGLLWHGEQDLGTGKCRESLAHWFGAVGVLLFVIALYQGLRESVQVGSTEPLRRLKLHTLFPDEVAKNLTDEAYLVGAHTIIAQMIIDGLSDCRIGVGPIPRSDHEDFVPGEFTFAILPSNLFDTAWAELAYIVGQRAEIKTCPGCGRFFSPESGKQKYCTPACASNTRYRRWKERQTTD